MPTNTRSTWIPSKWMRSFYKPLNLLLLVVLLWAQFAHQPVATVKAQTGIATDTVMALRLESNLLMWSTHCGVGHEFYPSTGYVRTLPAGGGAQRTLQTIDGCSPDHPTSNVISDSSYFYWQTADRVVRLSRSATAGTAPQTIANKATPGTMGEITQDGTYLYWTENGTSSGSIFRARKNRDATREPMLGETAPIRQLRSPANNQLLFISDGDLMRITFGSGGGITLISTSAQSYVLDGSNLFWVDLAGTGSSLAIRRAPVNGPYAVAPLHTIDGTGNPSVIAITVDATNLYWHEHRVGGPIYRMAKGGGTPQAITETIFSVTDLVTNGRDLFWHNNVSIQRLSTTAAAITVDLVPGTVIEVVQAIQNPLATSMVPLVQGKETFVRVYPRIAGGSLTRVSTWPVVTLTGRRDGVVLGQLTPITPALPLGTAAMDRTTLNGSYLFRLPAEWTSGRVELVAEVNPRRIVAETNTSNNRIVNTVDFTRKAPMCLDIIPVETVRGRSISSWDPEGSLQFFFDRANALLPTETLRHFWRGGPALRKLRWYLLDSDPFTVSTAEPDAEWLIFWLNARTLFDSDPGGCEAANATTSRVAMLPNFAGREVNGMAGGWSMLFFAFPEAPAPHNRPGGGMTLAHELAHLHGRGHVDCPVGVQSGIDRAYPYPTCQLDGNPTGHIGIDPFTRQLVLPTANGDLMSANHLLGGPRWPSDYTWRGLFSRISNRSAMAASAAMAAMAETASVASAEVTPAAAASTYVVSGIISGTTVLFNHTYAGTGDLQELFIRRIGEGTEVSTEYEVRAYDGADTLIGSTPLSLIELSEDESSDIPFITRLDLAIEPSRIEVARMGGDVIGTLTAGANPPVVTITSPSAGAEVTDSMEVAWNGSDSDGDLLRYIVRYSNDNGATWISLDAGGTENRLTVDMSGGMPGGVEALVQVIASDGLHTTIATSELFSTARHAPEVTILNSAYEMLDMGMGTSALQSESIVLHGLGYDAEDGPLSEASLQWSVTGPITRSGDGEQLTLFDMPPGRYDVRLRATDSDGESAETQTELVVAPKLINEGAAPLLDGVCDDESYTTDLDPIRLRYSAELMSEVRAVRAEESVYFCYGGLHPVSREDTFVILRIDPDNSGGDFATPSDLVYRVGLDGSIHSGSGNGTGDFNFDEAPVGIEAAVSRHEEGWSAEMRIDIAAFGGWGRLIRMEVSHNDYAAPGDVAIWPLESGVWMPSRWGLTALGQQAQTIDFLPLADQTTATASFVVSATASSGLAVRFTSEGSCVNSGNRVTVTGAGTCIIAANQPGNDVYLPATTVQQSFEIIEATAESDTLFLPSVGK